MRCLSRCQDLQIPRNIRQAAPYHRDSYENKRSEIGLKASVSIFEVGLF
ncbi:MAG: UPF0147 family protein [Epsilonproteobacteria bacterium]|nr:UPF0147 family protein [Campylobacterota bacterium]